MGNNINEISGQDKAAAAAVAGLGALAGKKLAGRFGKKGRKDAADKKAAKKQDGINKALKPYVSKIEQIDKKITDIQDKISDLTDGKQNVKDQAKKKGIKSSIIAKSTEKWDKKIEQQADMVAKLQQAKRAVKDKYRDAKEKVGGEYKESFITFKEYNESTTLDEKQLAGLKKKAEETGISYGILKKVFDRGMAAWKTGHRPGATPHQWAYARVNSFATKSKGTWGGADKDLAKQARAAESVEEARLQSAQISRLITNLDNKNETNEKLQEQKTKLIKRKAVIEEKISNIAENRAVVYNPRMIRAFIKQVEKKFPKYKGEIQQVEKDEIVFPNDPKLINFFKGAKEVNFVLKDSVGESTAAYAKSLEKIANDRKMKNISKKDKETLLKIAALMAKEK